MFQNNLLMGAASISAAGGYTVDYSCRFNDNDSAFLQRTFGTGNSELFSVSFWWKVGNLTDVTFLNAESGASSRWRYDTASQALQIYSVGDSSYVYTPSIYRDPSAWYHVLLVWDLSQDSGSRVKWYVNGVQQTVTLSTEPTSGSTYVINTAIAHEIGAREGSSIFMDGYLSQYCFIDNAAKAVTDFGEFDDNGVWRPIDITGLDYTGTNSFLLDFADSSNLGNDVSGNDNDWASSGLAADDQVTDTPTSNFPTWSPIDFSSSVPLSNGNLVATFTSSWYSGVSTFKIPSSGKWSFQGQSSNQTFYFGIVAEGQGYGDMDTTSTDALYYYGNEANFRTNRSGSAVNETTNVPPKVAADTNMEFLIDMDNKQIGVVISDTVYMAVDSGLAILDTETKIFTSGLNGTVKCDFGQGGYEPSQTGYKALSTANLPTPTILDGTANFQPTLYTGDGSVRNIDQTGNSTFQPDWVWIKSIASSHSHMLIDAPRGVTKQMHSNSTAVETTDTDGLTSFDSDGFGLGTGSGGYNDNTETFVAWQWLAGGGAGSSNEAGTINTTTTTVNTTAGISIGTYTGTGSAATIGHGLGVAPQMVIVKERANDVGSWYIYHEGMAVTDPEDYYLVLNHYDPYGPVDDATIWNDTAPTSTVFSIGTNDDVNGSTDTYVYYAFADVEGFSKFGSYVGNANADGPVIYTGFKPSFILLRGVGRRDCFIYDSQRSPYNQIDKGSIVNEGVSDNTGYYVDFLSNGFKIRSSGGFNASGEINIFMAFAEYPFGGEDVTPATAF